MYLLPQNALRMHHFDAIYQKISGGGPPDPHLREGVTPSPTLPLSALRASVKPSASLATCAPPAVEVLDPPLLTIRIKRSFPTIRMKKIVFQNSEKLSPVFRNIRDSFFTPIILITKLSNRLKGRKHADVKFTFASHVRA